MSELHAFSFSRIGQPVIIEKVPNRYPKARNMNTIKDNLIAEIDKRVADKILEPTNAELLKKLIRQADNDNEAMSIAELGTTYKRTGLHFDKRLERMTDDICYFKKNETLSFHTDDGKPVHKLIIGDNYPALQNLLIQYKNKIDVIYIDPPYGKDSMGEFAQTNYENAITRDNLLSMLYPCLMLAKMLLSESGIIFCSIDDRNQAYVKCLFDEVFGEGNYVDTLHWKRKKQPSFLAKHTAKVMEYVLVFAKKWESLGKLSIETLSDATKKVVNLTNQVSIRHFIKGVRVKCGDKGLIPKGKYTIKTMAVEYLDDVYFVDGITQNDVDVRANFSVSQEKIDNYISKKLLFITANYGLRRDVSEEETNNAKAITDLLLDWGDNQDSEKELKDLFGDKLFDYSKPTKLIVNLIKSTNKDDAIILDFFAGSGTTGHAVLEMNKDGGDRTFILCQLNETTPTTPNGIAYDVTAKRLKRIMTGECYDGTKDFKWIKENQPYGGNLDVYDLATIPNWADTEGKTPFDVIDETLYGQEKFNDLQKKVEWVCGNFANTQKRMEE